MQFYTILRQGSMLLVSILLAKSMLSQGAIGHFEMLLFIGSSLTYFWVNSLNQALLSMYPGEEIRDQKQLLFNAYSLFCFLGLVVFVLLWQFGSGISALLVNEEFLPHLFWYALFLLIDLPTFLIAQIYLLIKKVKPIMWFSAFSALFYVLAILVPVFLGEGLELSFKCLIGLALAKHLWMLLILRRGDSWRLNPQLMKRYIVLALPLMAFALLSGLTTMFDNWLVGWFYQDEATFAIFRFGARELPVVTAMTAAFSSALIPEVATDLNNALSMIKVKSVKLFHLLFPLSAILILTSYFWFPLVFNPSFQASAAIFNVYLLVLISRIIFTHTIMIGLKETRPVLVISVLEVSLNVILSFWLVHLWGMPGIAMATVIAFLVEKILTAVFLYRRYGLRPDQYLNLKWYGFYCLLLAGSFAMTLT